MKGGTRRPTLLCVAVSHRSIDLIEVGADHRRPKDELFLWATDSIARGRISERRGLLAIVLKRGTVASVSRVHLTAILLSTD